MRLPYSLVREETAKPIRNNIDEESGFYWKEGDDAVFQYSMDPDCMKAFIRCTVYTLDCSGQRGIVIFADKAYDKMLD